MAELLARNLYLSRDNDDDVKVFLEIIKRSLMLSFCPKMIIPYHQIYIQNEAIVE